MASISFDFTSNICSSVNTSTVAHNSHTIEDMKNKNIEFSSANAFDINKTIKSNTNKVSYL